MKKVVILSAGKSSRFLKSAGYMKQMIDINGEPLIINTIKKLLKNGFKNIEIVLGHNSNILRKIINSENLKVNFKLNKKYYKTEMIDSMLVSLNCIDDIIFFYSDIYFDEKLLLQIKNIYRKKNITIPLISNWKKIWHIRKKEINNDAESLKIDKNNNLIEIGDPIKNKLPKYQFMGIIYIPSKHHYTFKKNYLNLKDKKIQLTQFLNKLLSKNLIIKTIPTKSKWYEFDDFEDLNEFNNHKFLK